MESWNRSWYGWRQPYGAWRPPLRPPHHHGNEHCSIPLWEREFCSSVGNISWQRFCENKRYVSILGFGNLEKWDDSGALENFQNAKTRFWANYHGQPSDIPLPDPDMYIDQIDHHCKVDPKLVAGLDKVGLPVDSDNNSAPVLEWPNAEIYNKFIQYQSENWGVYIEKPAAVNEWDWDPNPACNATWGGNNETSCKWGNNNSGWGAPLEKPSRRGWRNNHNVSNNRYKNFYGGTNNKRHFKQTNNKQRDHDEGFQRSRWQDSKGKKKEWRPVLNSARQNVQGMEGSS